MFILAVVGGSTYTNISQSTIGFDVSMENTTNVIYRINFTRIGFVYFDGQLKLKLYPTYLCFIENIIDVDG